MSLASPELCAFVRAQAPPHYATPNAPDSWSRLRIAALAAEFLSDRTGQDVKLPVYDGGCEDTIYPDAATNHAFRAWHDSIHLANGYSFSREDEIKVGLIHMQQARRAGLSQRDQDMLIADTIGQIEYYEKFRRYVENQSLFVSDVLKLGLSKVLNSGVTY